MDQVKRVSGNIQINRSIFLLFFVPDKIMLVTDNYYIETRVSEVCILVQYIISEDHLNDLATYLYFYSCKDIRKSSAATSGGILYRRCLKIKFIALATAFSRLVLAVRMRQDPFCL